MAVLCIRRMVFLVGILGKHECEWKSCGNLTVKRVCRRAIYVLFPFWDDLKTNRPRIILGDLGIVNNLPSSISLDPVTQATQGAQRVVLKL